MLLPIFYLLHGINVIKYITIGTKISHGGSLFMKDFKRRFLLGLAAGTVASAFVILYAVLVGIILTRG